jgi:ADP-ribose pyrophosphatase YjhB (NUDIX family)
MLDIIKRLKSIADIGLLYATDGYDRERYTEIHDISLSLMAQLTDTPLSILTQFEHDIKDYPTPKVNVRALVLNDKQEVLLAREKSDGRWSLPGGWADIGLTAREVAVKEVFEETGLAVEPFRLLAVFDKKCHPHPPQYWYVYKLLIGCRWVGGSLSAGFDILDAAFFSIENLPALSENRILASQIQLGFQKLISNDLETYFD